MNYEFRHLPGKEPVNNGGAFLKGQTPPSVTFRERLPYQSFLATAPDIGGLTERQRLFVLKERYTDNVDRAICLAVYQEI